MSKFTFNNEFVQTPGYIFVTNNEYNNLTSQNAQKEYVTYLMKDYVTSSPTILKLNQTNVYGFKKQKDKVRLYFPEYNYEIYAYPGEKVNLPALLNTVTSYPTYKRYSFIYSWEKCNLIPLAHLAPYEDSTYIVKANCFADVSIYNPEIVINGSLQHTSKELSITSNYPLYFQIKDSLYDLMIETTQNRLSNGNYQSKCSFEILNPANLNGVSELITLSLDVYNNITKGLYIGTITTQLNIKYPSTGGIGD